MRPAHAAAIILAITLTLIASLNITPTAAAQTDCVQPLTHNTVGGNGSFVDIWINDEPIDCPSVNRPADEDAPGDGRYLARYYTFSLSETADVTITLESPIDTYLYLLEGAGMGGTVLHKNDDIDRDNRNFNSRIQATLDAGDYTIEATTYDAVYPTAVVEFMLTVSGITPQPPADPDRAALTALYNATNGPNWRHSDNWLTDAPLGEWQGVTTNDDGRVTELVFEGINLSGQLPADIGRLSKLRKLIFLDNELTGAIPSELGNLANLELLDLGHNHLSGTIPTWLGNLHALERLFLHNNQFTGMIPSELSTLGNLKDLHLHGNQLAGTIPPELGELRNLGSLWVHNNQLKGEIPAELGELSNLLYMGLDYNQLTGSIPTELGNLTSLITLSLSINQLTGSIPTELGNLTSLTALSLHNNQLTGSIPTELGNLTSLTELFLNNNQLIGSIPPELANLTSLIALFLSDNQLTGSIPPELANLTELLDLRLAGNQLTGCVPSAFRDVRQNDFHTLDLPFCEDTTLPPPDTTTPDCVESLPDAMTVAGNWNTDCASDISAPSGSGDRYARFYTFTLDAESDVTIDLSSNEDTFLYLRTGTSTNGSPIHENDDRATGDYDSRIAESLGAGTYTIEATTYAAGTTGSFTLTVATVPVSDTTTPEPPDPPTPDPTPGDPTSPIPAGCTLQNFNGTSVDSTWISDCVSSNRTVNGTHYAKFFSFSVSRSATYDLTLESRTDTYLILLDDEGDIIAENDDYDDGIFDLRSRSSGIRIALDPGNYIVEATTFAGTATGDFTLTIIRPELAALHALYNATDGANWINSGNWLSDAPLSDWHGIKTDDDGRVTEIYLIGNNLSGEIPAALGELGHLEGLYLARNDLSGSIPAKLGNLISLRTLMLFDNDLTGTIPHQLGNLGYLEEIHLGRNQLSGPIPTQLGNLENLHRLHLTVNDLSGDIPPSLGNLTNLRQLSIAANDLTGSIPTEIADLTELTHIYLWGNDLFASSFISNLDNLTNLQWLDIGGNRLDGSDVLPKLSSLTKLTGIGLHDSDLTDDDLQDYMDDLQALDLEFLNISSNGLSDPQTLVVLSRITTIQRLAINDNDFSGELPSTMTRLTLMRLFYFHDNDGLCAPADDDFQDWLVGIRDVRGDTCTSGSPAQAPAPSSSQSDQFAALLSTSAAALYASDESFPPPHSLSLFASRSSSGN